MKKSNNFGKIEKWLKSQDMLIKQKSFGKVGKEVKNMKKNEKY